MAGFFFWRKGSSRLSRRKPIPTSTLYQVIDSFQVESKLVRPEEPGNLVFEGKKPSKRTVPVILSSNGDAVLFSSWDELESNPSFPVGSNGGYRGGSGPADFRPEKEVDGWLMVLSHACGRFSGEWHEPYR